MMAHNSPLRNLVDPLQMFPLEIPVWNDVIKTTVEACNFYLHNAKETSLDSVILVRDKSLSFSAWRIQFDIPIAWMTGRYFL